MFALMAGTMTANGHEEAGSFVLNDQPGYCSARS